MSGEGRDTTMTAIKNSARQFRKLLKVLVGTLCLSAMFIFGHFHTQAFPTGPASWMPPSNIDLEVYELTASGANSGVLCSSNNYNTTNYGCTAFCENLSSPYCPPVGDPTPVRTHILTRILL